MDYDKFEGPDGAELRISKDQIYRTCTECGGDCYPDPTPAGGLGMRIAFVCPEHGVQTIVDPFEDNR